MLHVLVGSRCNNNCIFCMEGDREGRSKHVTSQTSNDVQRMIEYFSDSKEILFTCGEPTLNKELARYIFWAKRERYKTIALISNGRALASKDYLDKLIKLGLNKITISLHGHTAKLHDALTRTPGSFDQTVLGLRNISDIKLTIFIFPDQCQFLVKIRFSKRNYHAATGFELLD